MAKKNTDNGSITVKGFPVKQTKKVKESGLLANASITIDDMFAVRDIKICVIKKGKRKGEIYVQFPSAFNKRDEEWYHVFFPVTKEAREKLVNDIINEYENCVDDDDDDDDDDEDEE